MAPGRQKRAKLACVGPEAYTTLMIHAQSPFRDDRQIDPSGRIGLAAALLPVLQSALAVCHGFARIRALTSIGFSKTGPSSTAALVRTSFIPPIKSTPKVVFFAPVLLGIPLRRSPGRGRLPQGCLRERRDLW